MRKNYVNKLYDNLLEDEKYKQYCKIYEQEHYIDLELLKYLLKEHHELYYIFLKINLLLYYGREPKIKNKLNNDLKDYYYINKRILRVNDLDLILKHYFKNYSRCRQGIMKIVKNKLVSNTEQILLKLIYAREVLEQIRPSFEDEVMQDEW